MANLHLRTSGTTPKNDFIFLYIIKVVVVFTTFLTEEQKRFVSDIELNALADILNVSVDWLLGRE